LNMADMDIDLEIERLRHALRRSERGIKRKSVTGRFDVSKRFRVKLPISKSPRSITATPRSTKKLDTRTSRSRQMQPRKLTFGSGTNSRSPSRPPSKSPILKHKFASDKNSNFVTSIQSRKVRHKNARTVLNKMPAGGKSYARGRKSTRRPKSAYRGAVMPRWAKGETKHILAGDGCDMNIATQSNTALTNLAPGVEPRDKHKEITIGDFAHFSLNPIAQGNGQYQRNGRSVDGTYLRIQGHIFNAAGNHGAAEAGDNVGSSAFQKAYVRMLVLAVKGNSSNTQDGPGGQYDVRGKAALNMSNLFKRIDGSITGFAKATNEATAVASVRTLQLPVNKTNYTVLSDTKMPLASTNESFGSSDRLFDLKIPLKQKTVWATEQADTFEKNQIVFVVMTVDPHCNNTVPSEKIHLEFESKYSYKDF